jgi:hypothetical protein
LTAIDVKKAFLKGITYAELAATTKEPAREVNFELTHEVVAVLRTIPGFENFSANDEVLHCTKPGTGCKDAPRCFSIKLSQATNDVFGARSSTTDDQLILRHRNGKLDFIATKHVDDIKVACTPEVRAEFIQALEKVFGKGELDITENEFTNCGIHHKPTDFGYTMDQSEYLNALKPIVHPEIQKHSPEAYLPDHVAKLFLSLLMALAYTLQTRPDIAVYVNALQRYAQKPQVIHVKRLNAVVRWAQRNPLSLQFHHMEPSHTIEVHSDAGFRREEDDDQHATGRSTRGANYMRLGKDRNGKEICHLIDWDCGSIKTVTRSTFVSELQAAISATDSSLMLALTFHEIAKGPVTPKEGMLLRESGKSIVSVRVCIDAMSVFSALSSDRIKPPAEKSMLCHLLWIKELLTCGALSEFRWVDTRDMTADGHTKGSIPREAILAVASGMLTRLHAHKSLKSVA